MNSVSIIGRLTRDPETRQAGSSELCQIRIAVDRAGSKQDDGTIGAGFFDVTFWGKTAEVAARYLSRGREVGITGELRWREWEQDGNKRSAVDVNGRTLTLIGKGGGGDAEPSADAADDDIPF